MNLVQHYRSSIRKRMILGMWIMLVPLVVLGVGGLLLSRSMMRSVDRVVQTGMREIIPITELQELILRAGMPPNDYLILGDTKEGRRFEVLTDSLEKKFQELVASPDLQQEQPLLEEAFKEWRAAREIGERIFAVPDPVGNGAAARMMKRFDERVDRAADIVAMAYNVSRMKVNDNFQRASAVRRQETVLMVSVFLGAVCIALFGGLLISRSITGPVTILQQAMERYSAGDHSFRVVLNRTDEFGCLADTMNRMAERIELDGLTGVHTRPEFLRKLKEEIGRSERHGREFALLMVDVDHFKSINDAFGHPAGDEALRSVATMILSGLRAMDTLARYGGEEFMVLLPETSGLTALTTAERLRTLVAGKPALMVEGEGIVVTVSIGVAIFPGDAQRGRDLIAAADQAMYQAKKSGRNRVQRYRA